MSKAGLERKKPTMLVNASTEILIPSGLASAISTTTVASSSSADSTDLDSPQEWIHPFASSTSKLEVIRSATDKIDVEEEARLYDELCRNYEEDIDDDSVSFLFFFFT